MIRSSLAAVLVAAFMLPAWIAPVVAQPKADAAKVQPREAKGADLKGRLPTYYAQIVTEDQRQRIYQIQASYDPKIDALKAELDALVAKRDAEIRDVLSPAQQRRLDARIAEAQAKREAKAKKKAAEKKRSVVPVKEAG
jgi:Spy/CpxP family protein refolding chaperone